jgi:flavin reductase (DIM6/NTAB) family NADH-FMN oxidoreductase RutF
MSINPETLRAAMRDWSTGVTVVTAAYEGTQHGATVNSFTSISLEPATVVITIQRSARTHEMITKSGAFGVTILSAEQSKISDLFSGKITGIGDRFDGLQTQTLVTGSPLIVGGLAWFDCRVAQTFEVGASTLFVAEVLEAQSKDKGQPLVYHNRTYWKLSELG